MRDWINCLKGSFSLGYLRGRRSVVWLRKLSHELAQNCDCSTLEHVLAMFPGVSLIGNNPCVHKAAVPVGYTSNKDESAHGTLSSPVIMEIWSSLLWIGTRITRIL